MPFPQMGENNRMELGCVSFCVYNTIVGKHINIALMARSGDMFIKLNEMMEWMTMMT